MVVTTEARAPEAEAARSLAEELRWRIAGEVRFDEYSRALYSTDASNYQIVPLGVVLPKTVDDLRATIELAAKYQTPILPRGGGSSLAGQTVGRAVVVDTSKYLNQILEVDPEGRLVRVQPGIVLANLNAKLRKHGLMFGPDPSSDNRATIGGVVGNNSTGAHSILYGMTKDHVLAAHTILSDGSEISFGQLASEALAEKYQLESREGQLYRELRRLRDEYGAAIEHDFPRHWRRSTGYNLRELLGMGTPDFNPARMLASSEGTLAFGAEYTMKLVPRPKLTALVILQYDDLIRCLEATIPILACEPSAVELMDDLLIDLTRTQPAYARQIAFIKGNPQALLTVEFYGESEAELRQKVARLRAEAGAQGVLGDVEPIELFDPKLQADVWSVRKAGQGLLMSTRGDAKPIAAIEDVAVPVEHLAEYVRGVRQLVAEQGTRAAFYAHASAGCLHVRPLVDLKTARGVETMRELTWGAARLAVKFGGVMSGEHGDGLARGELNPIIFGPTLYQCMRELKAAFDPAGLMNPGKIVDCPPLTENLRYGADYATMPITTHLSFAKEGGFARAVEQCSGAGVCRKLEAGTMCPSFMATRDEHDSTRGRANALRAALSGRGLGQAQFTDKATYDVLDLCLSCKACKTECPTGVDMAKIKTEYLAHYYEAHGTPLRARAFGHIHLINQLGSKAAPLANLALHTPLAEVGKKLLGIHPAREIAPFARQTFADWFEGRRASKPVGTRGPAVYYNDTFTNYTYPEVGKAAVALLEAAGYSVEVVAQHACCGRPLLSKGLVEDARKLAQRNVAALAPFARQGVPIVGTEPSCILTLRDEYLDLLPADASAALVAEHSFMLDEFLAKLLDEGQLDIAWRPEPGPRVLFHGHCHQKALIGMKPSMAILAAAGCEGAESGAGCCGMAGSFGYEAEHYEISRKIGAERLFPAVESQPRAAVVAVTGVSCREQIGHFTSRRPLHLAEVLASRLAADTGNGGVSLAAD
ncbi:MAG TPA: FAD-linked oxidase C-terminal domain-containing protein [Thermomicrobiaceae bacterium]|nr:FAD-linked oxidase C-terminal domain-containing protein [Thermomicrobiaceae bacterium]